MGEKYGYTTKTYNLLATVLMLKNDTERALKIFESALNDLKLEDADEAARYLYLGNNDLGTLLINYIKCQTIRNGCGSSSEQFKNDEFYKRLFSYIQRVNPALVSSFFEERK